MSELKQIHLVSNTKWTAAPIFSQEGMNVQSAAGHYRKDAGATATDAGFDYNAELQKANDNCDRLYPVAAKHKGGGQIKKYNECLKSGHDSTDSRQKDYNKTASNSQLTNVLGGLASPGAGASGAGAATDNTTLYIVIALFLFGGIGFYLYSKKNATVAIAPPTA